MRKEYVYFIQSEKGGPIKIGITENVQQRLIGLQTAHPYKLVCLGYVEGNGMIERRLHWKFRNYQLNGEWFEPCDELLRLIDNLDDFDSYELPEVPARQTVRIPFDVHSFIQELYAAALEGEWNYQECYDKFKEALEKHRYSVTHTVKWLKWFERNQKKRFEEKRAVTGLKLDV